MMVPYTGSTAVQPSGPGRKPPKVAKPTHERGSVSFPHRPRCSAIVARFAVGRPVRAVWVNELGGVILPGGLRHGRRLRVHQGRQGGVPLIFARGAAARLRRTLAVPRVLGVGVDWAWVAHRCAAWLVRGAPARRASPAGRGPGVGVRGCAPGTIACRLHSMSVRLVDGQPAGRWPRRDARNCDLPPVDRLVVCHGVRVLTQHHLDDTGRCCGHVDFGNLGADQADSRRRDAVVAMGSFPDYPGQVRRVLRRSRCGADPARIDHYRRLWQAEDDSSR